MFISKESFTIIENTRDFTLFLMVVSEFEECQKMAEIVRPKLKELRSLIDKEIDAVDCIRNNDYYFLYPVQDYKEILSELKKCVKTKNAEKIDEWLSKYDDSPSGFISDHEDLITASLNDYMIFLSHGDKFEIFSKKQRDEIYNLYNQAVKIRNAESTRFAEEAKEYEIYLKVKANLEKGKEYD